MSVSAFEKLRKVAEKYNESPLDFYDHLLVAKKNSTVSPIYRSCMEKGEKYDRDSDPYANACEYYKSCALANNRDVEEIIDLSRNEIVGKLDKGNDSSTVDFFLEVAKKLNVQLATFQSKRLSIDALFLEDFLKGRGLNNEEVEEVIILTRTNFLMFLREDILVNQRARVKRFILDSIDDIVKMRIADNKGRRTIMIKEELWSKIETFRPTSANDLSIHDLARGIYLLVLNSILSVDKK